MISAAVSLAGCEPSSAKELGHKLVVHGVVTDSGTGDPLPGVTVTLLSLDDFPSQSTDAHGYFQFTDVLQLQNLLVQFSLSGYRTVTLTVNPSVVADGGVADGGIASFPGFGANVDGLDASIALSQDLEIPVAGTVYSAGAAAVGAQIALTTSSGVPVYQTKSGAGGSFSFPGVRPATYQLIVLPWDRDADGLSDTQFYSQMLAVSPLSGSDLGHLSIQLVDVEKDLVGSSFVSLSASYPITIAQLVDGVTGVQEGTSNPLFLVFGAEVDQALTSFELVQQTASGFSADIMLTVAWSHGTTVSLTPAAALSLTTMTSLGYQLRIRSLGFVDGTIAIPAGAASYGTINFTVLP
jgi:hypothetical protein